MRRYESETAGGKVESKEHILDERDELWVRMVTRMNGMSFPVSEPSFATSIHA